MNPLLALFLSDGADLLAQADDSLLRLERHPRDPALVNEVFRAAHTLKGSSGLFDFPELTRLTHAAEDLLAAVRAGGVELTAGPADDLLATFDLIRGWLAHVTTHERLPVDAGESAAALIIRLRAPLGAEAAAGGVVEPARRPGTAPPWLAGFDPQWLAETARWLCTTSSSLRFARYNPDQDCFFRDEDPLHLISEVPALTGLAVLEPDEWPSTDDYSECACLIVFVLATRAGVGELDYLFRSAADQFEVVELNGEALRRFLDDEDDVSAVPDRPWPADAEVVADARAILEAARRSLAVPSPGGAQLTAIIRSVAAAAHALGSRPTGDELTAETLLATIERLLGNPAEPAATEPAATEPAVDGGQVGARAFKVEQRKVDRLMELVGELNVATNGLAPIAGWSAEAGWAEEAVGAPDRTIKDQHAGLHRIAGELQAAVLDIRMLPLSVAFARLPRLVRDLSRRLGKDVDLVFEGADTMADKDVIEALGDPLVHLVRNSLDHGIEPGPERVAAGKTEHARITLAAAAAADGDAVLVEVSDDGRGADPELLRRTAYGQGLISQAQEVSLDDAAAFDLVFRPGFSTAERVSEVSGRGVGMDAVRSGVERLGGTVTMRSRLGAGTTVRLRLPLSMAVTKVLVVCVAGQGFGVPVDLVAETVRVPAGEIRRVLRSDVLVLRGEVIPVVDLARVLELPWLPDPAADRAILVVAVAGQRVGLLVERFHQQVDVLLKPMDGLLAYADEFAGTALLGDGLVLLVLNLKEVLGRAARVA